MDHDPFGDFWAASRLTRLTGRRLGERLREWGPPGQAPDRLTLRTARVPLARPDDAAQRWLDARRSTRAFAPGRLPGAAVDRLLAAVADRPGGGRPHASAGALHPLRCYALLLTVDHELDGRVARHDAVTHTAQDAGPCPPWPVLAPLLGVPDAGDLTRAADPGAADAGAPQLVLALVLDDAALLDKYGQRGGRFGLLEAGAATQSLALRLAADGLGGHLLGGAADDAVLALLGLRGAGVRLAAVMACGVPAEPPPAASLPAEPDQPAPPTTEPRPTAPRAEPRPIEQRPPGRHRWWRAR